MEYCRYCFFLSWDIEIRTNSRRNNFNAEELRYTNVVNYFINKPKSFQKSQKCLISRIGKLTFSSSIIAVNKQMCISYYLYGWTTYPGSIFDWLISFSRRMSLPLYSEKPPQKFLIRNKLYDRTKCILERVGEDNLKFLSRVTMS